MRLKILVVEDDALQADILSRMLETQSCYVETVADGRGAVRRLQSLLFDVALIDYRLPEIDGLGIASIIRETLGDAARPVLIGLTAFADAIRSGSARQGTEFDALCSKPPETEALMATIRECIAVLQQNRLAPEAGLADRVQAAEWLPAGQPQPHRSSEAALDKGPARPAPRILLVDDDRDLARLLHHVFTAKGYVVDVAGTGLEAIRLTRTRKFDVVVMDYNMPELNGLATAKVIYDCLNDTVRPRLIALTAAAEDLVATDPKWNMVFDEVISKQSGADAIVSAVQRWLGYAAYRGSTARQVVNFQSLIRLVDLQTDLAMKADR